MKARVQIFDPSCTAGETQTPGNDIESRDDAKYILYIYHIQSGTAHLRALAGIEWVT